MSTESAWKAAEEIYRDYCDRQPRMDKTIIPVWERIIVAACQTVAPPEEPSWPNREFSRNASYRAGVTDARLAFDKWRSAAPAVSTPPDSWRNLIGPQAEERCWERMCKSFHDKIADVLGLPHEPEPGFEPMLATIKQLVGAVSTPPLLQSLKSLQKECEIICGACQLFDGWKSQPEWSKWDEQIRMGMSEMLKERYAQIESFKREKP